MTTRLSISNFAGIARTLVALGIDREASMFVTTLAPTPRSVSTCASAAGVAAGVAIGVTAAGVTAAGVTAGVTAGAGVGVAAGGVETRAPGPATGLTALTSG